MWPERGNHSEGKGGERERKRRGQCFLALRLPFGMKTQVGSLNCLYLNLLASLHPQLQHPQHKHTLLFSPAMILSLSASCMTSHCSHISPSLVSPFPGELYGRDSKNSCSTKNWCHCLPTPPCFRRGGCKLGLADRALNRSTPRRGSTE